MPLSPLGARLVLWLRTLPRSSLPAAGAPALALAAFATPPLIHGWRSRNPQP